MSNIARLGAVLALNTVEFVKGLNIADEKSKNFKKNLYETKKTIEGVKTAVNLAGAAFVAFAAHAIKAADEMADLADANDTTIGKILEMKSALTASGGEAANVGKMFSSFGNAVNEATEGANDKMRKMFAQIGISRKELANASADELRDKALIGLSKIEEATKRNALATQLFGKAAKGVDFRTLGENAAKVAGHYQDQEKALKEAAAAAQKLEMFMKEVMIAAVRAIEPVTRLFNKIPTKDRIEQMTVAFQILGTTIAIALGVKAVKAAADLGKAIFMITAKNPWLLALGLGGIIAGTVFKDDLFPSPEDQPYPELSGSSGGAGRNMAQSAEEKKHADMIAKYETQIKIVKELADQKQWSAQWDYANTMRQLKLEQEKYDLSTNQYERLKLANQLADKDAQLFKAHSEDLRNARRELELAPAEEQKQAEKLYRVKVQTINDTYALQQDLLNKENEARLANFDKEIERQQSWAAGWKDAFKQYNEAAARASDRGAAAFQSVMSNMESALRKFVDTGKFAFGELVGSIIKDLAYMELRAQASAIFSMLWGSISSSFGASSTTGGNLGSGITLPKKASGGYVNSPTIVGENGAELFIPSTPGTVIPNGSWQQMAAAGSGGSGITVNGNYIANMSAIDTQSATQFLAANKNAIWASYQSANRSVPISR
jgi:lambda family phage tail tape measure protein